MAAKPLTWGPTPLRTWSKGIAAEINANKPVAGLGTSTVETSAGTAINATGSSGEEPSGGGVAPGVGNPFILPPYPTGEGLYFLAVNVDELGVPTLGWVDSTNCDGEEEV